MSDEKNLSIDEQVAIIQKVLNDSRFFDEQQLIESGIKKKTSEKEFNFDE